MFPWKQSSLRRTQEQLRTAKHLAQSCVCRNLSSTHPPSPLRLRGDGEGHPHSCDHERFLPFLQAPVDNAGDPSLRARMVSEFWL